MSILDRITKASESGEQYLKVLLWGPNGTGKSTLCGTAPAPILYLYTERQGLISFQRMAPDAGVIHVESLSDLRQILRELREDPHGYKSVCLDSFTEMQMLIVDEILSKKREKSGDEDASLTIKDHMMIHDRSKSMVRAFRDLPMHVVLTCLSETVVIGEDDEARTVTRIMLMGRKLPAQIGQFFNLVGFVYKAATKDNGAAYRVLFDGRSDIDTKGMPGLRRREEPDIDYWYRRAIGGEKPRDPDAKMIPGVSRTWGETQVNAPGNTEAKSETEGKKASGKRTRKGGK